MKYPRLPYELDRRRKISIDIIPYLKILRKLGFSYRFIAKKLGVSKNTIQYHLDMQYKTKVNKKRYALLKQQKEDDPEFKKQSRKRNNAIFLENTKRHEPLRVYKQKSTYKWKKKKYHSDKQFREKIRKWAGEAYHKKSNKKYDYDPQHLHKNR